MQLGIFAKTFPGRDPLTVLTAAAAAGYAGVAYNTVCSGLASLPDAISPETADAVTRASASTGQRIFSLSATYNMAHPDPAVRHHGLDGLEVLAASARSMGTALLTLCSGTRDRDDQWRHHPDNARPDAWHDMMTSFEGAITIAERHDVLLGVEPEVANVVSGPAEAVRLVEELGSDRIRIVLDPANLLLTADPVARRTVVEDAVGALGDRICMAHAKDRDATGRVVPAGRGVIDFDHFLRCLAEVGFDGPVVTHGLSAADAPGVASDLTARLERLDASGGSAASQVRSVARSARMTGPDSASQDGGRDNRT